MVCSIRVQYRDIVYFLLAFLFFKFHQLQPSAFFHPEWAMATIAIHHSVFVLLLAFHRAMRIVHRSTIIVKDFQQRSQWRICISAGSLICQQHLHMMFGVVHVAT
ncbi:hypothetical protein EV361DRAFT_929821 [Lentinula raphanica]|nr:hypothetical protein EV361DRAFT_929821 [Lentinula raphanica]